MSGVSDHCVVCGAAISFPKAQRRRVCESGSCQQSYRTFLTQGGNVCTVCGVMVKEYHGTKPVACNSPKCRQQAACRQGSETAFCSACGIHLDLSQRAEGVCGEPYCRERGTAAKAEQTSQRIKEKRQHLEFLAMSRWFVDNASTQSSRSEESIPQHSYKQCPVPIVVPANLRPLTPPPAKRIAVLRENLIGLIKEAEDETRRTALGDKEKMITPNAYDRDNAEAIEAEKADSDFDTLAGQACSTCRGFCCFAGREHAFLRVSDVLRTMADKKISKVETIVDEFLQHIPDRTVEGSCLFHGSNGCGMPRRMRSDMCNTTLCPSLINLYHKSAGQAESQLYLIAATNVEDDLDREPRVFAVQLASLGTDREK